MIKKLTIILFVFMILMPFCSSVFVSRVMAECQIGAAIGDWDKDAAFPGHGEEGIINYENVVQRKVACVKIWKRINDEFPFAECLTVYNHGSESSPTIPYIDIHPSTSDESEPLLLDIINGDFDSYIRSWAEQAKEFGKPLWICFNGEMNGAWHSGSGAANGGAVTNGYGDFTKADGPEIYVDAWRHIHDIFTAVGADNVAWVWAVGEGDWPPEDWNRFENYYPGDDYVNWLGVDGYNWNRVEYGGWKSFQEIFDGALNRLRAITTQKPIVLAEFACAHKRPDKNYWIEDTFALLKTDYPYVECFIWFDINKEENWLIDSAGNKAVRGALSDSYFSSDGNPGTPALNSDKLINIALNKSATASSVESTDLEATKAVDGAFGTRWSSQHTDPQWLCVDLGAPCDITRVILDWETAYGKSYQIQLSDDGLYWTDAYGTTTGNGGVDNIPLTATARYVRMVGSERGTGWGYSLLEFGIYGIGSSGGGEQEMHIYSIDMSTAATGPLTSATAKIKIVDTNGQPVSEALVNGHWSGLTTDNDSPTTDESGLAQCNSDKTKSSSGTFIFTVDNVSKDGWIYDSEVNVESSDSVTIPYSGSYRR